MPGKFDARARAKFLTAYSSGLSARQAAEAAGVTLNTVVRLRNSNDEFKKLWDEAHEDNTDQLEQKALELATQSDVKACTMLIFMLKARKPHVYRDNVKVEHTGSAEFAASFASAMSYAVSGKNTQADAAGSSAPVH